MATIGTFSRTDIGFAGSPVSKAITVNVKAAEILAGRDGRQPERS